MEKPASSSSASTTGPDAAATTSSAPRSKMKQELLYVIAQHLVEDNLFSTAEHLLRKAKLHLNLDYITELVLRGKWEKIEKRLNQFVPLAFTEDDKCTNELLSLIKRQRFLHMLYTGNTQGCVEMLRTDLAPLKERDVYARLSAALLHSQPLTLDIFKDYSLDESYRRCVAEQLKISITRNPLFLPFLELPSFDAGRLRRLVNQSLNWQHDTYCKPRQPKGAQQKVVLTSLLVDHKCDGLPEAPLPTSPPATPAAPAALSTPLVPKTAPVTTPEPSPVPAPTPAPAPVSARAAASMPVTPQAVRSASPPAVNAPAKVTASKPAPTKTTPKPKTQRKDTSEPPKKVPRREVPSSASASASSSSSSSSSLSSTSSLPSSSSSSVPSTPAPAAAAAAAPVPSVLASPSAPPAGLHELLLKNLLHEWALIDTKTDAKVSAVAFRPMAGVPTQADGLLPRSILVGFNSGQIALWTFDPNVRPKQRVTQIFSLQDPQHPCAVMALAWADPFTFAVGYRTGEIALYKFADGAPKKEKVLTGHTDMIHRLLYCPFRPNTLVSCSKDKSVIMWNTQQGVASKTYEHDGPVYGICMARQDGLPYILATGKAGLKCFILDKTVTFEPLENGQYCTDVRIIGGRLFSAGPLCDSIMEWYRDKTKFMPLRFKGYQRPDRDGPMPRIEAIMDTYIAVPSKAGIHLWDINDQSQVVHSTLVPGDDLVKGGIGGITHDNGLLAVFSRTRHQVAIFGPAIQTTTNKRRRTSPEPTATSTGNGVQTPAPAPTPTPVLAPVMAPAPAVLAPKEIALLVDIGSRVLKMRFVKKDLITISKDHYLRFWQVLPHGVKQTYAGPYQATPTEAHQFAITSNEAFALSLIGSTFSVTDIRQVGERLNVDIGKGRTTLAGHIDDNNVIGVGTTTGSIIIHSVKDMSHPTYTLATGHDEAITSIAWASKQLLVATDAHGRIYFTPWQGTTLITNSLTLPGRGSSPVYALVDRSRGNIIVYSDVELGLFHLASMTWKASLQFAPGRSLATAALSLNDTLLVCALTNSSLMCLHPETLAVAGVYAVPEPPISLAAQPSADSSPAFAVGTESGKIYRVVF